MIPSIGKQKISYKDHKNINFEPMSFYINLAQKIISKMGHTFFNGLSKEMLKNEDAISFVASSIMMGDWRWKNDNDSKEKNKTYKTLYSYRNQCGIWAMKTYVTKQYKKRNSAKSKINNCSINYSDEDINVESMIADKNQKEPLDILAYEEKKKSLSEDVELLLDLSPISDKQKEYIKMYYYEDMTLEQIGKQNGVTREAIRQSIKAAISKIKEFSNNDS
jgi:RNA polymerase sigma factor (sigma-70 family)